MQKSGASSSGPPPLRRDIESETKEAFAALVTLLPRELLVVQPVSPNGPYTPNHIFLTKSLEFQASLVADLTFARNFGDAKIWKRCIAVYASPWLGEEDGSNFAESVRSQFLALDQVCEESIPISVNAADYLLQAKHAVIVNHSDEEGELLCDTLFSLAYGALLLLSHTKLRLFRGRRYGILGSNGSGKSTLMRQLRDGKVENFPPQSQLRCVMVEHSLQGEDGTLTVLDFVSAGKSESSLNLKGISHFR